jgi:hypothetical protein
MSHECTDCYTTFDTLASLRLHDCSSSDQPGDSAEEPSFSSGVDPVPVERLDELLAEVGKERFDPLYSAVAVYESQLRAASDADESDRYRGIRIRYRDRLVDELDEAKRTEGWGFLEEFLEAYPPDPEDGFSHVTTILQNVAGRGLIRTRLEDGVAAIPVDALEYFETIRSEFEPDQDTILEGLHPYGWGIGHPEFDVAGAIYDHASRELFSTRPILENAFYADQHAAVETLERILREQSLEQDIPVRRGELISGEQYILGAVGDATSDEYWPMIPRGWDRHEQPGFEFELADDVERRIRDLTREDDVEVDLAEGWEIADIAID